MGSSDILIKPLLVRIRVATEVFEVIFCSHFLIFTINGMLFISLHYENVKTIFKFEFQMRGQRVQKSRKDFPCPQKGPKCYFCNMSAPIYTKKIYMKFQSENYLTLAQ